MNPRATHKLDDVPRLPAGDRSARAISEEAAMKDAWRSEIRHRRDELHSGAVVAMPFDDVRQRLGAM